MIAAMPQPPAGDSYRPDYDNGTAVVSGQGHYPEIEGDPEAPEPQGIIVVAAGYVTGPINPDAMAWLLAWLDYVEWIRGIIPVRLKRRRVTIPFDERILCSVKPRPRIRSPTVDLDRKYASRERPRVDDRRVLWRAPDALRKA